MAADQLDLGTLVHETSVTTGTGNQTLVAANGKQTFNDAFGTGGVDLFDYFISNPGAAEWEIGTGHLSSATVLVRDTVNQSSNGDAAVSFTAGKKNITNDLPAALQGGAWDLLETVVASSDSVIDITGLSSKHFLYRFIWQGLEPVDTSAIFQMRTDANAGASFDTGASDYGFTFATNGMDTTPANSVSGDNTRDGLLTSSLHGDGSNQSGSFEITCFNPSDTEFTKFAWSANFEHPSNGQFFNYGGGVRSSAALVDAVQFSFTATNIFAGILKIYGLRA